MTNKISSWLNDFWKRESKPDLEVGQIWTLFSDENSHDNLNHGTVVIVLRLSNSMVQVIPTHFENEYARGIDTILSQQSSDLNTSMIVMIDSSIEVESKRFESARFLGKIFKNGLERILAALEDYSNINKALITLQFKESMTKISDGDLSLAIKSGITKLFPDSVSSQEFIQFKKMLISNLVTSNARVQNVKNKRSGIKKKSNRAKREINKLEQWMNQPPREADSDKINNSN